MAATLDEKYPGSVIHLQHDLLDASVSLVPNVIEMVRAKGYRLVSLPECLYGAEAASPSTRTPVVPVNVPAEATTTHVFGCTVQHPVP